MKLVIRYIFFEKKKKIYGLPHVNLLVERKKSLPSVNLIRGSAGVRRISQSWTWSSCRVVWRLRANPPAIKQPQTTAYVCVCVWRVKAVSHFYKMEPTSLPLVSPVSPRPPLRAEGETAASAVSLRKLPQTTTTSGLTLLAKHTQTDEFTLICSDTSCETR